MSKNFVYKPNQYSEVEVETPEDVTQYLVILRMDMPCSDATINFLNFDNDDGNIVLGDFCGTKSLWCKFE